MRERLKVTEAKRDRGRVLSRLRKKAQKESRGAGTKVEMERKPSTIPVVQWGN